MPLHRLGVTPRDQDEGRPAIAGEDPVDQLADAWRRPVQVFEDDHELPVPGELTEHTDHRVLDPVSGDVGGDRGRAVDEIGEHGRECGRVDVGVGGGRVRRRSARLTSAAFVTGWRA